MIKPLQWLIRTTILLLVLLAGPALIAACSSQSGQSWRDTDRSSAGIAPISGQLSTHTPSRMMDYMHT